MHFACFLVYIYELVKVLAVLTRIFMRKSIEANDSPSDDSMYDSMKQLGRENFLYE